MRSMNSYSDEILVAVHALEISADQLVAVLSITATMICQRQNYCAQHTSPVAHGRRRLNEGFDRAVSQASAHAENPVRAMDRATEQEQAT